MRAPNAIVVGMVAFVALGGCDSVPPSSQRSDAPSVSAAGASASATLVSPIASASPVAIPSPVAVPSPIAALDARLLDPIGLAVDAAGNLYVSDCVEPEDSHIFRIDPFGMLTVFAGIHDVGFMGDGGPATSAMIHCPLGMAVGADGSLYFADHANNRIRRIDSAGIITTVAGSGPAGVNQGSFSGDGGPATAATLREPYGVAIDPEGNMFFSDRDNDRIRKVDRAGIISTIAGNGGSEPPRDGVLGTASSLQFPLGVITDAEGCVLFADGDNKRVRMIDGTGIITTIAGTGENLATGDGGPATRAAIADPENMVFDAADNLYITDTVFDRLRRIDTRGIITTLGSKRGGAGLAIDGAGNLFVSDAIGGGIYRIDIKGIVTRIAGKAR